MELNLKIIFLINQNEKSKEVANCILFLNKCIISVQILINLIQNIFCD